MAFIISACADQAELITRNMAGNPPSYRLVDLFLGGEKDLTTSRCLNGLGAGTEQSMLYLVCKESPLINVLQKVIWKTSNPFGSVVCLHKFYNKVQPLILIFYYSIFQVSQSHNGSTWRDIHWKISTRDEECLLCCMHYSQTCLQFRIHRFYRLFCVS